MYKLFESGVFFLFFVFISGCALQDGGMYLLGSKKAPSTVSGMEYDEIHRVGEAVYEGEMHYGRISGRAYNDECRTLRKLHDENKYRSFTEIEGLVSKCVSAIRSERSQAVIWLSQQEVIDKRMVQEAAEKKKRVEEEERLAQEEAEREAERRKAEREAEREAEKKRLAEEFIKKLNETQSSSLMENYTDKPVATMPSYRADFTTFKASMICFEMAYENTGVSSRQSGRNVYFEFDNVRFPRGDTSVKFHFIENDDYWLLESLEMFGVNYFDHQNKADILMLSMVEGCNM